MYEPLSHGAMGIARKIGEVVAEPVRCAFREGGDPKNASLIYIDDACPCSSRILFLHNSTDTLYCLLRAFTNTLYSLKNWMPCKMTKINGNMKNDKALPIIHIERCD